ncbi:AI-2E family transporter [SAR86 cluster bacterium]|jgi:putative permease|nr:AI-2E family transporter [SAR86 cluster bacterium]
MFEDFNNLFKRVFSNEETIFFALLLLVVISLVFFIGNVLTPFIISIIFAYLLVGLQVRFENFGMSDWLSLTITYGLFILIFGLLFLWLVPLLVQQIQTLVVELPNWFTSLRQYIAAIPTIYPDLVTSDQIRSILQNLSNQLSQISQDFLSYSIAGIQNTVSITINLIMLPILVFFLLFDRKSVINSFLALLPKDRPMLSNIWDEMDDQLSNYVRGKTIEIIIVGVVAAIIFSIFGLPYTALLSVMVGFSVLIPFLGAIIATIPVMIVGFFEFGISFEFWMLFLSYTILQMLDGNVLVPVLFSDAVKLHPFFIILAVFVFGGIFGFWGVFFAIPMATFIKAVWNAWPSSTS